AVRPHRGAILRAFVADASRRRGPHLKPRSVLYDVRHKTTFSYEDLVSVSHHVLHLAPREHPLQRCFKSETIVEPAPAVDTIGEDYFGNPVEHLTVQQPHKVLVVDARARVEVRGRADALPFEASPAWETVRDR